MGFGDGQVHGNLGICEIWGYGEYVKCGDMGNLGIEKAHGEDADTEGKTISGLISQSA